MTQKISEKSYERVDPGKGLRLAINMALSQRNPLQISDSHAAPPLNALLQQRQFGNANFRPQTQPTNQFSRLCGLSCSPNHIGESIEQGKTCKNCDLLNQFARVCRKAKFNLQNFLNDFNLSIKREDEY